MYYVILDSGGNLVESFDERNLALSKLEEIVGSEPEAAEELALFTYDAQGEPVGQAEIAADLLAHA
jgi:hypothetical protein